MVEKSVVYYLGKEDDGSSCGYCKSSDGFQAFGMWAYSMTVKDYQDLIDRGFRRSGHFCYKPEMRDTCCPLYTIRNRVDDFCLNSSHRRVLKRVAHFLNTGEKPRQGNQDDSKDSGEKCGAAEGAAGDTFSDKKREQKAEEPTPQKVQPDGDNAEPKSKKSKAKYKRWKRKLEHLRDLSLKKEQSFESVLADYRVRRQARLDKNKPKTLEELLNLVRPDAKHKLTCRLVRTTPRSEEYIANEQLIHAVYAKYQMRIHGDKQHECTKKQFERFLVESPLQEEEGALPSGYGSFHYQYWLDDKLIAFSILDFLSHCISSVYFVYDVDYEFLSLGTYSALKEIQFTREMSKLDPALRYYYLGYYVHSCQKMRYKGQYHGSDLLCPETHTWHAIEKVRDQLDRNKYSRFCPDIHVVDEGRGVPEMCHILYQGMELPWEDYKRISNPRNMKVKKSRKNADADAYEYATLVGADCCRRMVLVRK